MSLDLLWVVWIWWPMVLGFNMGLDFVVGLVVGFAMVVGGLIFGFGLWIWL